jgi:hypothetical protein
VKFSESLEARDVEAIAKSRINRDYGKWFTYVIIGMIILILAGFLMAKYSGMYMWIADALALLMFFAHYRWINGKQKKATRELLEDWNEELDAIEEKGTAEVK